MITTGYLEKRSIRESLLIKRLEIENAARLRELVPIKEIHAAERAVQNRILSLHNSILEVPDRLAGELAGEDDPRRVREVLHRELCRVVESFAQGEEEVVA